MIQDKTIIRYAGGPDVHWALRYIGLPFVDGGRDRNGVDCWGLLCLVYSEIDQIELPLHPHFRCADVLAVSREIANQVAAQWTEIPKPVERCAVAMSQQVIPHHVGLWTQDDGGKVIHAWNGLAVAAESIRRLRLRGMRTIKFYRYGIHP